MMRFKTYLFEGRRLFRFDDLKDGKQIIPKPQKYAFDSDGSGSGNIDKYDPPKDATIKTGLFADEYHRVLPYATPRSTRFIVTGQRTKKSKPTIHFDKKDKDKIMSHVTSLSQYGEQQGFKKTKTDEFFREGDKTPRPMSQKIIKNPLEHISKHYEIKFVDDLDDHKAKLDANKTHYEAEGEFD